MSFLLILPKPGRTFQRSASAQNGIILYLEGNHKRKAESDELVNYTHTPKIKEHLLFRNILIKPRKDHSLTWQQKM